MKAVVNEIRKVGWMGFGDQGAPMAQAVAQAGFELHVWARRPQSLAVLGNLPHTTHEDPANLAAACDMIAMCLREDADVQQVIDANRIWDHINPGSVLVNHGTGLPQFAVEMSDQAAGHQCFGIDAPVSGGHPAAVARQLTTIVGGNHEAMLRAMPVFESFSKKVVLMGSAGSGQMAKLINNTLLMTNQRSVQQILRLAGDLKIDVTQLVDVMQAASGSSFALQALQGAVNEHNAQHLRDLQVIDMDLFEAAIDAAGVSAIELIGAAVEGARGLPDAARRMRLANLSSQQSARSKM